MPFPQAPTESRCVAESVVELRAAPEGRSGPGTLVGYGATFGNRSRDLGGWFEEIDPGAFGEPGVDGAIDLARHVRVLCRTNHDSNLLLGTTDAGSLRVFLDDVGLRYENDLPDTSYARDLAVLAARGDIRFSSFAFRLLPDGWEWAYGPNDELVRHVTGAQLVDVAPVADPAYWDTSSGLRSLDLDSVRAELDARRAASNHPTPPGAREQAARDRASAINAQIGRGR